MLERKLKVLTDESKVLRVFNDSLNMERLPSNDSFGRMEGRGYHIARQNDLE